MQGVLSGADEARTRDPRRDRTIIARYLLNNHPIMFLKSSVSLPPHSSCWSGFLRLNKDTESCLEFQKNSASTQPHGLRCTDYKKGKFDWLNARCVYVIFWS